MEDQTSNEYILEHAREIGMLVVTASTFDSSLAHLLTECLYLSPLQENALLRPLGTRAKLDILQRLSKFAFDVPAIKKEITSFCEKAKGRFNERNTVIHGSPGFLEGKLTLRLYSGNNAFNGDMEEWPKERVTDLYLAIDDLRRELDKEIRPLFDTWLRASRQFHESHWRGPHVPLDR